MANHEARRDGVFLALSDPTRRAVLHRLASEWSDAGWLALNLLVLVAGCVVAIAGATQFVGPGR